MSCRQVEMGNAMTPAATSGHVFLKLGNPPIFRPILFWGQPEHVYLNDRVILQIPPCQPIFDEQMLGARSGGKSGKIHHGPSARKSAPQPILARGSTPAPPATAGAAAARRHRRRLPLHHRVRSSSRVQPRARRAGLLVQWTAPAAASRPRNSQRYLACPLST